MFEDYSFRARQVVFLARLTAGHRGAEAVEVEDLLTALIIEDQGGFVKALSDLHNLPGSVPEAGHQAHEPFLPAELASDLLTRVQALCTHSEPIPNESELPLSQSVQRAFTRAASLRDELQQSHVQPLHVLAAMLGDLSNRVAQTLSGAGITREEVLKSIREEPTAESTISQKKPPSTAGLEVGAPVYSNRTRSALFLSRQEARMHGSLTIEIEHMLIALILEDQGSFLDALSRYDGVGVDMAHLDLRAHQSFLPRESADDLLARVEAVCSRTQPVPKGSPLPMSEGLKRALSEAALLRDQFRHSEIEPLHLLAAIVGDDSSRGAEIFRQAGITRERIIEFRQNSKKSL